jgi:P-type Cu+ transporter
VTVRRGARDPVCGMTVDRSKTPHRTEVKGQTVYFCSAGCKANFDEAPERYVDPAGREAQSRRLAGRRH